jgi:hypothetical protein
MEVLKTALSSVDVRRSLFDNGVSSATIFLEGLCPTVASLKEQCSKTD